MHIATRISASFAAAAVVMFGASGALLVDTESRDLHTALQRELFLLGRSVGLAAENALRDRQIQDVRETMTKLERLDPTVDLLLYDPSGAVQVSSHGSRRTRDTDAASEQAMRGLRASFTLVPPDDPAAAVLGLPLQLDDGELAGALVVVRPLDELLRDLRETRTAVGGAVLFFAALAALLAHLIGRRYIGRPLVQVGEAMRSVRAGDLTTGVDARASDEIGALVTEFNAMVEELRLAREELEEQAEARRRMVRALQEADKLVTIGQLSAGLAHEIGSPLQVLNGRARALRRKLDDPERVLHHADVIVEQTDRIARIVEQLLEFARRRPSRTARIVLAEPVSAVLELLAVEARRRGVTLTLTVDEGLPPVDADPDQMQQVVLNLVNNALQSIDGEGAIELRLSEGVTAADTPGQRCVCIEVRDTGAGVPGAVLPHLFEPFFTTRASKGGTGLGLAVVKSIVQDHGGTVSVESSPGGSTFIVELPAAEAGGSAGRRAEGGGPGDGRGGGGQRA